MFKEHKFIIWGTECECGNECSILQNEHHPWDNIDFTVKLKCSLCKNEVVIDREKAEEFYNRRIYSYYDDINGTVIDLGCGGGFLSRYLLKNNYVNEIYGIDNLNLNLYVYTVCNKC